MTLPPAHVDHGAEAALEHGLQRSSHWEKVKRAFLAQYPSCVACKRGQSLITPQVHHIIPFHFCRLLHRPDLELDPRNMISLCETEHGQPAPNHHFLLGHAGSFRSSNVNVRQDAMRYHGWSADQIRADTHFRVTVAARLPAWADMTAKDKHNLSKLIHTLYPDVQIKVAP